MPIQILLECFRGKKYLLYMYFLSAVLAVFQTHSMSSSFFNYLHVQLYCYGANHTIDIALRGVLHCCLPVYMLMVHDETADVGHVRWSSVRFFRLSNMARKIMSKYTNDIPRKNEKEKSLSHWSTTLPELESLGPIASDQELLNCCSHVRMSNTVFLFGTKEHGILTHNLSPTGWRNSSWITYRSENSVMVWNETPCSLVYV
jgi:hypothetical protein